MKISARFLMLSSSVVLVTIGLLGVGSSVTSIRDSSSPEAKCLTQGQPIFQTNGAYLSGLNEDGDIECHYFSWEGSSFEK